MPTDSVNGTYDPARPLPRAGGPISWILNLFSSIWLGVILLIILFVYSSIGSAGIPVSLNILEPATWKNVREVFEMSEFQWFNWWPFTLLNVLICVNLTVATLRRIPFNVVNLGVWMIHSGLIILAIGSVWYFTTKVEGDTPVARRMISVTVPGHEPVHMVASPGNRVTVGNYVLRVFTITPDWELLSGDDAGTRAYKVTVGVNNGQTTFLRELLAGYPQYTEDLIPNPSPEPRAQPWLRAKNELGTAIIDETVDLALEYAPQEWFYLMESRAVYLRELGSTEWIERPVRGLGLFNDYVASPESVWVDGSRFPELDALDVRVPATDPNDPLPDVEFTITEYLRYANMQERMVPGGIDFNPAVRTYIETDRESRELSMEANDPERRFALNGNMLFGWARDDRAIEDVRNLRGTTLRFSAPEHDLDLELSRPTASGGNPDAPFTPLGESPYSFRVLSYETLPDLGLSLVRIELRKAGREEPIYRWVFTDGTRSRGALDENAMMATPGGTYEEPGLDIQYREGESERMILLGGPEPDDVRIFLPFVAGEGGLKEVELEIGTKVEIFPGVHFTVLEMETHPRFVRKPVIVPIAQRDRNVGMLASMVRLNVPQSRGVTSRWLPYHLYPFARPEEVLRRNFYAPELITLDDGRRVEVMFSRERMRLTSPVVLDSFEVESHIGGFTGQVASILDYVSNVRFGSDDGLTKPMKVHMNNPVEHNGLWYFQSQWDPPDPPRAEGDPGSSGLNYTILGVANRHGVNVQLFGCCLSVLGMLYAFYIKPIIKRRRQQAVYADVAARRNAESTAGRVDVPEETTV